MHVENGLCTLTATDLDTWLVAELPARGDDVSFVFSRTKDVMKACAHFEGELALTFVPKDEKEGKIEALCGQRAAEFSVTSHENYPECGIIEGGTSLRVNAAALYRRIERVRYAAEKGCLDRRPQSACVQFREDHIFSLDGRRMACDTQPGTVFPASCLLRGDALTHLRAFGENEVTVQIGAHKVCFSDETLKLYVRRYGVDTYDPDAAIPRAYREVITVQTDELLRELTYLKECIGSCMFPYVRFAGQELPLETEVYTEEGFCDLRFGRLHGETAFATFFMRLTYPIGGAAAYLSLADRSAVSAHDLAGERVGSTGSRRNESAFSG